MKNQLKHIAVILDGNRRFAKLHGWKPWVGHEKGADAVEIFLEESKNLGIKEVTFYTLSTENLKREKEELQYLYNIFRKVFQKFRDDKRLHEDRVKIRFIGDLSLVPEDIANLAREMERITEGYGNYIINFCFAYGGRLELVHAFNKLANSGKKQVSEKDITESLWLKSEPDLIIRTGGVKRLSNFLPWQSVYSELIFFDKLWPEFTREDLRAAVEEFGKRKRNFGK